MVLALALAAQLFTLEGKLVPPSRGAITIHSAASPFASSTLANVDGTFRFEKLEAGTYSLIVLMRRRGELRMTVSVGPGTAYKRGRVRVEVPVTGDNLNRQPAALVSARDLAVPEKARKAYADAARKLARKDIMGATRELERAVEIAPQFAAAWNHLGTIAYQTRHFEEAEKYFRTALDANPEMYEPLVNLGGVLVTTRNFDEAWKVNVEAVLARPNDALAHSQLGITYLYLNKLDLAEKHLLESLSIDPGHFSHPQIHLAEVYLRRKDSAKAAEQIEDFIRRHPDDRTVPALQEALKKWRHAP